MAETASAPALATERLLDVLDHEARTAANAYWTWRHLNSIATEDKTAYSALNRNARTWNIVMHSLQETFLLTLGRLFDTDGDAFSVHSALKSCIRQIDDFKKPALEERKRRTSKGPFHWVAGYVAAAYEVSEADLHQLKPAIAEGRKLYDTVYRCIRNKVIAHTDQATIDAAHELYERTSLREIERLLLLPHQVHGVLSQLLWNGRLTSLDDHRDSVETLTRQDVNSLYEALKNDVDES